MLKLPDFDPEAEVYISVTDCTALSDIGILPKIMLLELSNTGITDPDVVDALINACLPSAAGVFDIGSLMAIRTSASDDVYDQCIDEGWTVV